MRVPLTTRDFLDRAELVYGDRVGIVDEPNQPAPSMGEVSYREVARRGRALQAGLDALGVGEGERIAVVSHNAGRLLECLLSLPSSGRVVVPVNFRLQPEEVSYIVGHSGARVLFVDPELEASLKRVEAEHRFTTGEEYEQLLRYDTEPVPWSAPDEDATATINYTSGTTARPKGVQMTHRNEWVNAVTFGMHMQVSDRDVYMHTLPMFHCNGWGLLYTMAGWAPARWCCARSTARRSCGRSSSTA
jgi:acyl-CoA synthetase (AMP-forming)/AMP-acid ligase II